MKKTVLIEVILVLIIISINLVLSEVRINEVELNPGGLDLNNEWVEIYSSENINPSGWKIVNHDNEEILLNQTINNYLVIGIKGQFLDNDNESIRLYNGNNLVSYTPILKDVVNDNKSWSYCNGGYVLITGTKGYENMCNNINPVNNTSNNTLQNQNTTVPKIMTLDMDWDSDEIRNGDDFDINIKANNLEDKKYDIKVYIYKDDNKDKIISDSYYNNIEDWVYSNAYISDFFSGPGNKTKKISMRIRNVFSDFTGDAKIGLRIREKNTGSYKIEIDKNIEILKQKEKIQESTNQEKSKTSIENNNIPITGSSISLRDKNKETNEKESYIMLGKRSDKNKIVYESNDNNVLRYSLYSFVLLIALLVMLIIIKFFIG
ncbi:MAG: hypothetical protein Q8N99_05705 [Nanoarchaeota archaeon]|nr:hypothetical protein [Nanoarchaeota archaeon]